MWFYSVELTVFALLILAFAITEQLDPGLYAQNRSLLDLSMGLALTISLLTSGYLAAMAVASLRKSVLVWGAACFWRLHLGPGYTILKLSEYRHLAAAGRILMPIVFHPLLDRNGLSLSPCCARNGDIGLHGPARLEQPLFIRQIRQSGIRRTFYWHMVDLIWVVLFPLIYLPR